jgi:cell fate (sporulation/competence/biofilm development) regulator YlbF (YheA/YmcA/DUF963 family)
MTDDDFDKVDEDFASEFDFVDNKQPAGTTGAAPQQPAGKGSPIIPLLLVITLLGGGYYAYSHFFANKKPPAPPEPTKSNTTNLPALPESPPAPAQSEPPVITPQAAAESLQPANTNPLEAALPQPTSDKSFAQVQKDLQSSQQSSPAIPQEMRSTLQSLSDEMTSNVNNIKQLEGAISTLSTTVDQLNKTISAMDNRVLSLTETVDGLSQDLTNIKKVMVDEDLDLTMPSTVKFTNKKQVQPMNSSSPSYSVHAIIPGRAWLKSSNGQIITVTEGDQIGDYGKVSVIDSANGLVRTSSGIIIR